MLLQTNCQTKAIVCTQGILRCCSQAIRECNYDGICGYIAIEQCLRNFGLPVSRPLCPGTPRIHSQYHPNWYLLGCVCIWAAS